jgi:hypothetical protein
MVVERINNEVVLRIPAYIDLESVQRIIDLISYKEAFAQSKAKQEGIDQLAKEINKAWWEENRSRFIQ